MTVELSVLLLLLAIIIILRFVSWFGLKGLNRLAGSSATAVRQIRAREGVAGLSLRFKQAYPKNVPGSKSQANTTSLQRPAADTYADRCVVYCCTLWWPD